MKDSRPLEIFFSYAHADEDMMNDVRRQLIVYERNGRILKWHDRMIPPGSDWRDHIDDRLATAKIILLFMSPHFIESRYCYEIEGQLALQRNKTGEAIAVPVILRPCAWEETPFGDLQALPKDGKPISRWSDRDEVCLLTARGVMSVVDVLTNSAQGAVRAVADKPRIQNSESVSLVYCRRCGHAVGESSTCISGYVSHEFARGRKTDFCSRCGTAPGKKSNCISGYVSHEFKAG